MGIEQRPVCPENDALAEYMLQWWTKMGDDNPKLCTQNMENNFKRAFTNVCKHKTPITTLKEFKGVKGIGKWFVAQMQEFFNSNSVASQDDDLARGKKGIGTKSYLPQKNSAAYALLISLHRGTADGSEFMYKKELIDAAESSGLSRVPIGPEKGRGKPGLPGGSSKKEWYCGWNAMGTLIDKGLVYRTSCPAKYKLSDKGRGVALECLSRSGMLDYLPNVGSREETSDSDEQNVEIMKDDIPEEFLERLTNLGYTREQVLHALAEVSVCPSPQEISTLWPTVLCLLRENEVYDFHSDPQANVRSTGDASTCCRNDEGQQILTSGITHHGSTSSTSTASPVAHAAFDISCSSLDYHAKKASQSFTQPCQDVLRLPPLEDFQKFEDAYKVILILDDREGFVRSKSSSRKKIINNICDEFKIQIEVQRLPVGDAIWVARHKQLSTDYVLDFIVERKNVEDLRISIRDNRYRDQKLRLQRTGIKKIIYVVEGDPNACEGADSIKTACFTTEILEGFDVQRTSSLGDTLRQYGFLTLAIIDYYKLSSSADKCKLAGACPTYTQFIKKCEDIDKMTVSDVFATQLMQVPQVTEEVAMAVLDCYPTLSSLLHAYTALDGDTAAQEELLMKESEGAVSAVASRKIFRFVWTE